MYNLCYFKCIYMCFMTQIMVFLGDSHVNLKRMYILVCCRTDNQSKLINSVFQVIYILNDSLPEWSINYWQRPAEVFKYNRGFLYFPYPFYQCFFLMNFDALLLCIYTLRIAMCPWWIDSFIIIKFIPCNFSCSKVSDINILLWLSFD